MEQAQNHLSSTRHEKNLCKMGPKIVRWWAQVELSGCGLRLCPKKVSQQRRRFTSTPFCHLWEVLKKKQPNKLSRCVILLHDNARLHEAQLITFFLNDFCWNVFGLPTYLPNHTPSNYYFFANLYWWLGGQGFLLDAKVKVVVHNYFQNLDKNFNALGISKLLNLYEKCIARPWWLYR